MADYLLGSVSKSSLLQLHQRKLGFPDGTSSLQRSPGFGRPTKFAVSFNRQLHLRTITVAGTVSDYIAPTVLANTVDTSKGGIGVDVEAGGGGGGKIDDRRGGGGGGGGGGGDGGGDTGKGEGGNSDEGSDKRKMALSMSQKLTLGYAALVGVGGVMGYLKSGSQKSLLAGGLSAALLYYVYADLPTRPVLASTIGFGISSALLGVMVSRFRKSGKVFPAGVVSLVSLVMTGGYLHGILRSVH